MSRKKADTRPPIQALVIPIWQPWADLIAMGIKSIETRTWSIKYRGLVVIQATLRNDRRVKEAIELYKSDVWEGGPLLPANYKPRFGVGVCTCDLWKSAKLQPGDKKEAAYLDHWGLDWFDEKKGVWKRKEGWFFRDVQCIEPLSIKGKQRPFLQSFAASELDPILPIDCGVGEPRSSSFESRQLKLF